MKRGAVKRLGGALPVDSLESRGAQYVGGNDHAQRIAEARGRAKRRAENSNDHARRIAEARGRHRRQLENHPFRTHPNRSHGPSEDKVRRHQSVPANQPFARRFGVRGAGA